jgi:predicted transposase YbfD/YdcC
MEMEGSCDIEMFSIVGDPRIERAKRHSLTSILMIGLMSTLGGGDGFSDMEEYGIAHEGLLKEFLGLPHGIPSHDTFQRVFARLDPVELETFLIEFTRRLGAARGDSGQKSKVIAIDGKTLRGSYDTASGQSALHLVSAWAAGTRLVLGQVAVDDKSNEITAIPALLKLLDVKGATVTIDAMGCQKEIAKEIRDGDADYVLALKGNHGNFHEEVLEFFSAHATDNFAEVEHTEFETTEKDHGRIEIRNVIATGDIAWSGRDAEWRDLQSFVRVTSTRIIGEKKTTENRYYISSLPPIASAVAEAIRGHWGIENRLHWMLDVNFREDYSRVRKNNAPRNLAVLRRVALNLLQACDIPRKSLRRKKLLASWNPQYLLSLVFRGV